MTGQPANSPARSTTSMNPVAGNTTVSYPMAGQPALGARRQPPGDQDLVLVGQLGHRTQQGMLRRSKPSPAASPVTVGANQ